MPKERALIEIRLAGLSDGVHEFDFTCAAGDFKDTAVTEAGFVKELSVRVVIDKNEDGIAVSLETSASAELACDICLVPITRELEGSYHVYYVYDQAEEPESDRNEEYRLIDRNTVSLDLTEDVRETLLLSVPMKVTCEDNPACHVYRPGGEEDSGRAEESSWQETLEKLKDKYR